MKAMLSQPMAGKTDEEIIQTRERAIRILKEKGYEIVNTLFTDEWYDQENMKNRGVVQIPLCFLAKSLENMSLCHAAYFCKGWEKARGCRLEHEAAVAYGLDMADAIVYGITGEHVQIAPETDKAEQGEETSTGDRKALYRVQVGAYSARYNAEAQAEKLRKAGFDAAIVQA